MTRLEGPGSHALNVSDLNVSGLSVSDLSASDRVLWGGSFLVVVALHAAAFVGFQPNRSEGDVAGDLSIMIDIEEMAAAPNQGQSEATPGPEQVQTDQISEASVAQEEVPERTPKEEREPEAPKLDVAKAPEPEVVLPEVRRTAETSRRKKRRKSGHKRRSRRPRLRNLSPRRHQPRKPSRDWRPKPLRVSARPLTTLRRWSPGDRASPLTSNASSDIRPRRSSVAFTGRRLCASRSIGWAP
jgi:hypothetical protein